MSGLHQTGWRTVIGSSSIMSLALLGDALLYAVLPAYAADFGLTLAWVGVMLSANRIVRVFAYGISQGPALMLAARILWGLTYATLVLATLSYAIEYRERAGTRIGVGQAIQRLGPIAALLFGAWLVGKVGPNSVFFVLAIPTALAIPLAMTAGLVFWKLRS
jgi:MFS family permease